MSFNNFTLEALEDDPICYFDWIVIIDKDGTELLPKSCGSAIPPTVQSLSNQMTLIFLSYDSGNQGGFQAELSENFAIVLINVTETNQIQQLKNPLRTMKKSLYQREGRLLPIEKVTLSGLVKPPMFEAGFTNPQRIHITAIARN